MKDIRCLSGKHKKKLIHTTKLTSTEIVTIYYTWEKCKRCGMKAITCWDTLQRKSFKGWKKEWEVDPYSNNFDNIIRYDNQKFERMREEIGVQ